MTLAAMYGGCSCSHWSLCSYHRVKYMEDASKRADEKFERSERMLAQQAKGKRRRQIARAQNRARAEQLRGSSRDE